MNETCTDINEALETYYLPTMYGIEFIVGLIGNLIVICGYVFCLKEWKCSNIYLFNLSIADLSFICTLPMFVVYYGNGKQWIFGDMLCKLNRYVLHANMYISILFLSCISIDRYLLVLSPMRLHLFQKKQSVVTICGAMWLIVTLEIIPILTFIGPNNVRGHNNSTVVKCVDYASSGNAGHSLIYSLCLTACGFLLPLCIMGFFCAGTSRALTKLSQERVSNITLEKPLTLVILALVIFSVFFTPYHIMRNVRILSRMDSIGFSECTIAGIKASYAITRPIAFLNSTINPIFYFLLGDKFRETITCRLKAICLKCTSSLVRKPMC